MDFEADLPDELTARAVTAQESDESRLTEIGIVIAGKRKEAIEARRESGIEAVWMACEEAYVCIDDSNRHEFGKAKWAKPVSMNGPLTSEKPTADDTKSTAFVRMTSRYVDAGASRVGEIILPIGDKAFSFGPTPVPDLVEAAGDMTPLTELGGVAGQVLRPMGEGEQGQPDANGMVRATKGDFAKVTMDKASQMAEKAEKRIFDWMVECNYPAEARKLLFDSSRIGVGVLKGPFPDMHKSRAMSKVQGGVKVTMVRKVKPAVKWIDPWNCFPAKGCGENIHDGDYFFERDYLSSRKLGELKKQRDKLGECIYLTQQIDKVLKEGPGKVNTEGASPSRQATDKDFEIWYFTGSMSREDLGLLNAAGLDELPDELNEVSAIVTMVNDTVIQATINPLDSGNFAYRVKPWSRRAGHWAGVGPGEQVSMPQRMVNAASRALLNNAGLSSGVQIIIDQLKIIPADGKWVITPNKIWYTDSGETVEDVSKAFQLVQFPNQTDALMAIIQYAFKLAEEATNIPLISQGQTDKTSPETFGAAELQNNNANTFLRSQGYSYDDCITEPLVKDFYEYLLLDPSVPDDEKGDFEINARGSIAMVEKAIQEVFYVSLLAVSKDPAFGVNPAKVMEEILKSKRIDARRVSYTEEEKAAMAKQQKPEDPTVQAARIRADATLKASQSRDAAGVQKSKIDSDRDTQYQQALNERAGIMQEGKSQELELRRELEVYKENNSLKKELDKIKAMLAVKTMELTTQVRLSGPDGKGPQVATPAIEPEGRAPDDRAFQQ